MSLLIELVVPDSPTSEAIGPPMLVVTMMSVPLHTISVSMLIMSMYDIMVLLYIDCDSRSTMITDNISIDTLIPDSGSSPLIDMLYSTPETPLSESSR